MKVRAMRVATRFSGTRYMSCTGTRTPSRTFCIQVSRATASTASWRTPGPLVLAFVQLKEGVVTVLDVWWRAIMWRRTAGAGSLSMVFSSPDQYRLPTWSRMLHAASLPVARVMLRMDGLSGHRACHWRSGVVDARMVQSVSDAICSMRVFFGMSTPNDPLPAGWIVAIRGWSSWSRSRTGRVRPPCAAVDEVSLRGCWWSGGLGSSSDRRDPRRHLRERLQIIAWKSIRTDDRLCGNAMERRAECTRATGATGGAPHGRCGLRVRGELTGITALSGRSFSHASAQPLAHAHAPSGLSQARLRGARTNPGAAPAPLLTRIETAAAMLSAARMQYSVAAGSGRPRGDWTYRRWPSMARCWAWTTVRRGGTMGRAGRVIALEHAQRLDVGSAETCRIQRDG